MAERRPPRRITSDMIYALTAPPMADGVERDVLLWRDDRAMLVNTEDVLATGGTLPSRAGVT